MTFLTLQQDFCTVQRGSTAKNITWSSKNAQIPDTVKSCLMSSLTSPLPHTKYLWYATFTVYYPLYSAHVLWNWLIKTTDYEQKRIKPYTMM